MAFVRPFAHDLAAINKRLGDLDRDVKTLESTAMLAPGLATASGPGQLKVRESRPGWFVALGTTMEFAWYAVVTTRSSATVIGEMLVLSFAPGAWYGTHSTGTRSLVPIKLGAVIGLFGG